MDAPSNEGNLSLRNRISGSEIDELKSNFNVLKTILKVVKTNFKVLTPILKVLKTIFKVVKTIFKVIKTICECEKNIFKMLTALGIAFSSHPKCHAPPAPPLQC